MERPAGQQVSDGARSERGSSFRGRIVLSAMLVATFSAVGWVPGLSASPSIAPIIAASPGARSLGDPFYPSLGNGGYDVQTYDLDLVWEPPTAASPLGRLEGTAELDVIATQHLSELTLDLTRANTNVSSVTVDGVPATHASDRLGRKLVVTPGTPIASGQAFVMRVRYIATPHGVNKLGEDMPIVLPGQDPVQAARDHARGFLPDTDGGFLLAAQPNGAHTLFPSNDHPTDKAFTTVRLTTPAGMLGVATGVRTEQTPHDDGSLTTTYRSADPVPTHVLAVGVGRLSLLERSVATGLAMRSVVPTGLEALAAYRLDGLDDAVAWLEDTLDRTYPFEAFGVQFAPGGATSATLEGQTLVLTSARRLDPRLPDCAWLGLVVHEAAHQWFGNLVALERWDQKWLSEGHATYYERLWLATAGCDPVGFEARMRLIYGVSQAARDKGGPPDDPRGPEHAYDSTVYDQGALALFALRELVGPATYQDIERRWLDRFGNASASTDDFIATASEVHGKDLRPFLEAWLRGSTVPPMPGHADWSSAPPTARPAPDVSPPVRSDPASGPPVR